VSRNSSDFWTISTHVERNISGPFSIDQDQIVELSWKYIKSQDGELLFIEVEQEPTTRSASGCVSPTTGNGLFAGKGKSIGTQVYNAVVNGMHQA
jgi:hypothetical protein